MAPSEDTYLYRYGLGLSSLKRTPHEKLSLKYDANWDSGILETSGLTYAVMYVANLPPINFRSMVTKPLPLLNSISSTTSI